jgi:hypothetical protein
MKQAAVEAATAAEITKEPRTSIELSMKAGVGKSQRLIDWRATNDGDEQYYFAVAL